MPLSVFDYEILRWAKDPVRGILVATKPNPPSFLKIHPQDNVVVGVLCGDGLKFNDQISHQWNIHQRVCGNEHTHVVGVAGGPLSLAPEPEFMYHPLFRHRFVGPYTATQHDLEEVEIGCFAKQTNCVELVGHSPCRLAEEAGLNLFQVIRSTVNAVDVVTKYLNSRPVVQRIAEQLALPVRVDCYFHAEQLTQFKTRAINIDKFYEYHDEFEAFVRGLTRNGFACTA